MVAVDDVIILVTPFRVMKKGGVMRRGCNRLTLMGLLVLGLGSAGRAPAHDPVRPAPLPLPLPAQVRVQRG